jgi:proteasome lid subunit RPN8/RPN11
VVIGQDLVDQILQQVREGFPNETCGVIASKDGIAQKVYPIHNSSDSPVHYQMDPQEQLQAVLDIEDNDWDMGAIYHSHTRTRAYPSQTDVSLAFYPDALQIIVSLADFERPDIRAYRIEDGAVTEEPLRILP